MLSSTQQLAFISLAGFFGLQLLYKRWKRIGIDHIRGPKPQSWLLGESQWHLIVLQLNSQQGNMAQYFQAEAGVVGPQSLFPRVLTELHIGRCKLDYRLWWCCQTPRCFWGEFLPCSFRKTTEPLAFRCQYYSLRIQSMLEPWTLSNEPDATHTEHSNPSTTAGTSTRSIRSAASWPRLFWVAAWQLLKASSFS